MVLFAAVSAAGQLIDLFGGFTLDSAYDPLSQNQSGPFGRANQLLATTLLFATGGYLILVHGLLSTYQALPLTGTSSGMLGDTFTKALTKFFEGAVEVAAPLLAVLILSDFALALVSRAAPALNVFSLSFPVKILVTLLLIGVSLPLLPGIVEGFVGDAIHAGQHTGLVGQ
jgi:flagellar biosynthetic protein FliR